MPSSLCRAPDFVALPIAQTDQQHARRVDARRQFGEYLRIAETHAGRERHRMIAGISVAGQGDVGMSVYPDHGRVIPVLPGQKGERSRADGAVAPERHDPGRDRRHAACSRRPSSGQRSHRGRALRPSPGAPQRRRRREPSAFARCCAVPERQAAAAPRKYPLAASSGFLISGTHRTMSPPCHWG